MATHRLRFDRAALPDRTPVYARLGDAHLVVVRLDASLLNVARIVREPFERPDDPRDQQRYDNHRQREHRDPDQHRCDERLEPPVVQGSEIDIGADDVNPAVR